MRHVVLSLLVPALAKLGASTKLEDNKTYLVLNRWCGKYLCSFYEGGLGVVLE